MPLHATASPVIAQHVQITRDVCIRGAARHYGASEDVIRALIRTEGGTTGEVRHNKDGSVDMGLMQINSVHLTDRGPEGLWRYGITANDLIYNECLNIYIGTWYVQMRVMKRGDLWKGIGDYRSRTPSLNVDYQWRVYRALKNVWAERN
ncbi:MAG: conjugal transfer protein [Burkholderiaceae bacterium]|nr:MAG: conjugal transfer protein [Burkholderiaceae bacterium]